MSASPPLELPEDRYFDPNPAIKSVAQHLYDLVADEPLICPHTHVDPGMFADPDYTFGSPAELLIIPDHYIHRVLYSQGVPLESLGVPRRDGGEVEEDHRAIWRRFAEHFYLFRGTPTGMWLRDELHSVFGVRKMLNEATADAIYDQISEQLQDPDFTPRRLFEQFNIEVLATTDPAHSDLAHHRQIRDSDWSGDVRPTFRPDQVTNLRTPDWKQHIQRLSDAAATDIVDFSSFIRALEDCRSYFKEMGATATDHGTFTPYTEKLSLQEADSIFQKGLQEKDITEEEAVRFRGNMLMEMARMSEEDGLVMQLHPGAFRDHNQYVYNLFGPDSGGDIPIMTEFTRNLHPLLNRYGNSSRFRLIVFTLDESTYSRELAPLAGHYPALKLGPPWWFHDSWNGMQRFRERVMETAGLYNTVGFNDDTRAFPSIPARHDLARRADANWLADLVVRHVISEKEAEEMIQDVAYELPRSGYNF